MKQLRALGVVLVLAGCGWEMPGGSGQPPTSSAQPPSEPRANPAPRQPDGDFDGLPDGDEIARGSDPLRADSDGDGFEDGVEVVAGTDPTRADSIIPPNDFYVVLPHQGEPLRRELRLTARLGRGDVFFLVDTTGSMKPTLHNLRESLSTRIAPAVEAAIADVRMGVGSFRDFPWGDYGRGGDWPFRLHQQNTDDLSAVQRALNDLDVGDGGDDAESLLEGLYDSVRGSRCPDGFGEACFRQGSQPIVVVATDAPAHNGPDRSHAYDASVTAREWSETMEALREVHAKVAGVVVDPLAADPPPTLSEPSRRALVEKRDGTRRDLEALARETGSHDVYGQPTVYTSRAGQVDTAVVDGIVDLVASSSQDVTARALDDPQDKVDARKFIRRIEAHEATRATRSLGSTFYGVSGGTSVTFAVTFANDFAPEQERVQVYRAEIEIHNLPRSARLDVRNVYVVVPAIGGGLVY